jgi:hypothetical protein
MDDFGHEYLNELDSIIHNYHCTVASAKSNAIKEWAIYTYKNAGWCTEFVETVASAHSINIEEVCEHTGASFPSVLL